jgi:hypothetical protein
MKLIYSLYGKINLPLEVVSAMIISKLKTMEITDDTAVFKSLHLSENRYSG